MAISLQGWTSSHALGSLSRRLSVGPSFADHRQIFRDLVTDEGGFLTRLTAVMATTSAFSKMFLPFYLIGSSATFAATAVLSVMLVSLQWCAICEMASRVRGILLLLGGLYALIALNFLFYSWPAVPMTHLFGILIFHALFLLFGFAASRALKPVFVLLLAGAAVYAVVFIHYLARFGGIMQADGSIADILGVGDPVLYLAFAQKIGIVLALAAIAAIGLASNRARQVLAFAMLMLVLLTSLYISARGASVALLCSLLFLAGAALWVRSRKLALLGIAVITAGTIALGLFVQHEIQGKTIDPNAGDAISRTIREIRTPTPGLRLEIWSGVWHQVSSEPERLLFGRGIGIYPMTQGYGPPDWPLHKTVASRVYPHNVHLEMLYETGIVGLLFFLVIALAPLVMALRCWTSLSLIQKAAISMYVFHLVESEFSGSFAFGYLDQFFFALTVGSVALGRLNGAVALDLPAPEHSLDASLLGKAA